MVEVLCLVGMNYEAVVWCCLMAGLIGDNGNGNEFVCNFVSFYCLILPRMDMVNLWSVIVVNI